MSLNVEYLIDVRQDDFPVRGNALASGDPELDREAEDEILRRLDAGNIWAWCLVRVTAHLAVDGEVFRGQDVLGMCSYANEAGFKADGYYEDMCATALADLKRSLTEAVKRGQVASKVLGEI